MKEINAEARDRYFKEVSQRLIRAGFDPRPQEDGLLPVDWEGSRLCRLTAGGRAQFREEHLVRDGGRAAFDRVTEIAATTAEYMRLMETAPRLVAQGLEGERRGGRARTTCGASTDSVKRRPNKVQSVSRPSKSSFGRLFRQDLICPQWYPCPVTAPARLASRGSRNEGSSERSSEG